jgi:hypothetical protein
VAKTVPAAPGRGVVQVHLQLTPHRYSEHPCSCNRESKRRAGGGARLQRQRTTTTKAIAARLGWASMSAPPTATWPPAAATAAAAPPCSAPLPALPHLRRAAATCEQITAALQAWTAARGAPPREPDDQALAGLARSVAALAGRDHRDPGVRVLERRPGGGRAADAPGTRGRATRHWPRSRHGRAQGRAPSLGDARRDLQPNMEMSFSDERIHRAVQAWARWPREHGTGEPRAANYRAPWAATGRADAVGDVDSAARGRRFAWPPG